MAAIIGVAVQIVIVDKIALGRRRVLRLDEAQRIGLHPVHMRKKSGAAAGLAGGFEQTLARRPQGGAACVEIDDIVGTVAPADRDARHRRWHGSGGIPIEY